MFQLSEHIPDKRNRLEVLYKQYAHMLWYIARSYVKDEQIAEDMVQDAFEKLTKNPGILDRVPDKKAKSFLTTMVCHQSIDYLRKKRRKGEEIYGDYIDTNRVPVEYMPLERLVQMESMQNICKALRQLPESFRTPLELRMLHDLSNQEIADLLNVTKNLVAVRLNRGRNKLLKALEED